MKLVARPILGKSDILNANNRNKRRINEMTKKLLDYYADIDKKNRKEKALCRIHYYVDTSRAGCSAITTTTCRLCSKEIYFGNTCTDELCPECAKEAKLCCHCGGRMD